MPGALSGQFIALASLRVGESVTNSKKHQRNLTNKIDGLQCSAQGEFRKTAANATNYSIVALVSRHILSVSHTSQALLSNQYKANPNHFAKFKENMPTVLELTQSLT